MRITAAGASASRRQVPGLGGFFQPQRKMAGSKPGHQRLNLNEIG
jgi:hypothetical protein